jgi:type I restriction enzyme R subunit
MDIQREVLFEARHRCAVCCEPTPLERAHIRSWSKSKDHSAANLIALCANCHTRADHEKWGVEYLLRYKKKPCALEAHAAQAVSTEQQSLIDLVIGSEPTIAAPTSEIAYYLQTSRIRAYMSAA